MLQATTLEVILELTLHMGWQLPAPGGQFGREGGVILINDLVEKGLLRAMAFVS
jgi:hypothetical protein